MASILQLDPHHAAGSPDRRERHDKPPVTLLHRALVKHDQRGPGLCHHRRLANGRLRVVQRDPIGEFRLDPVPSIGKFSGALSLIGRTPISVCGAAAPRRPVIGRGRGHRDLGRRGRGAQHDCALITDPNRCGGGSGAVRSDTGHQYRCPWCCHAGAAQGCGHAAARDNRIDAMALALKGVKADPRPATDKKAAVANSSRPSRCSSRAQIGYGSSATGGTGLLNDMRGRG